MLQKQMGYNLVIVDVNICWDNTNVDSSTGSLVIFYLDKKKLEKKKEAILKKTLSNGDTTVHQGLSRRNSFQVNDLPLPKPQSARPLNAIKYHSIDENITQSTKINHRLLQVPTDDLRKSKKDVFLNLLLNRNIFPNIY